MFRSSHPPGSCWPDFMSMPADFYKQQYFEQAVLSREIEILRTRWAPKIAALRLWTQDSGSVFGVHSNFTLKADPSSFNLPSYCAPIR